MMYMLFMIMLLLNGILSLQYVLKKINLKKASKRERSSAEQEAKLLSRLKHPNIVSYKDSFEKDGILYIAMQFCEGGDLYTKLKENKGQALEERQVVEWFVQIAMALQVSDHNQVQFSMEYWTWYT